MSEKSPNDLRSSMESIQSMVNSLKNHELVWGYERNPQRNPELSSLITSARVALLKCAQYVTNSAPILRLPTETLAYIFIITRDVAQREMDMSMTPENRPCLPLPVVVSHVCSRWRGVALSNPFLWTTIHVFPPWNLDIIRLFLARSDSSPIDFQLIATEFDWLEDDDDSGMDIRASAFSLCCVLEKHLPRCRRISIQVSESFQPIIHIFHHHFCHLPVSVPRLQELSLEENVYCQDEIGSASMFPQGAPALITAKLGLHIPPRIPYDRLRTLHLDVESLSVEEFHSTVSQCHSLETLVTYHGFTSDSWPASEMPPLDLPSLSSLSVFDMNYMSDLLFLISAPALRHLVMARFWENDLRDLFQHTIDSGVVKFPFLKTLMMVMDLGNTDYVDGIRQATVCFPGIEEATFIGEGWRVALPLLKSVDRDLRLVWPHLHTLAVRSPIPHVRRLVEFREATGSPLRRIYLSKEALAKQDDREWLEKHLNIVELDVWDELRRGGMYYPSSTFGAN